MNGAPNTGQPQGQNQPGQWEQYYQNQVYPNIPAYMQAGFANRPHERRQFARSYFRKERLPRATAHLSALRTMNPQYGAGAKATQQQYLSDMQSLAAGNEPVNFRREGVNYGQANPLLSDLSRYARERLGTGLTPEEAAVFRGRGIETAEAAAAGSKRQAANMATASGLDPRAQTAMMGRIEQGRRAQRAEVERGITEQELKRKQEIEDLATRTGALTEEQRQFDIGTAERAREYDVGADLQRRQQLAALGLGLGAQEEGRYQYDTGFVEGRRQARLNREMLMHLARLAAPSGLEMAGGILGGIRGGLSPGG